jgi:formylglycine-generating enzyme required for sulfatase activity
VLADWLEENDDPRRGELLRLHRRLLATCCEPDKHPERTQWHSRIVKLIEEGVRPCIPQETVTLPGKPMTFSFIPPGSFLMGSLHAPHSRDEEPVHRVTLTRGFYLGVHPVTQAQWDALMSTNPSHFNFKGANRPVEGVSLHDCLAFCSVMAGVVGRAARLPTEAEWEYACRAGTTTEYHTGDDEDALSKADWYHGNAESESKPVGQLLMNPWGLWDLHGNVCEWCLDGYDPYPAKPVIDPRGAEDRADRVVRGGAWRHSSVLCRSSNRWTIYPEYTSESLGFRVALELPR